MVIINHTTRNPAAPRTASLTIPRIRSLRITETTTPENTPTRAPTSANTKYPIFVTNGAVSNMHFSFEATAVDRTFHTCIQRASLLGDAVARQGSQLCYPQSD